MRNNVISVEVAIWMLVSYIISLFVVGDSTGAKRSVECVIQDRLE